jgi:hypothetical protein
MVTQVLDMDLAVKSNKVYTLKDFGEDKLKYYEYLCLTKGLTKGIMLVKGPPRSGKTLWAVNHARLLREIFGIPVTLDFRPTEEFGAYEYIDADGVVQELEAVTAMVKKTGRWSNKKKKLGINDEVEEDILKRFKLYGHTVVLDEGTRWLDKMRCASNVNLLINDITKQWAHYKILLMVINHFQNELDPRYVQYIETQGITVSCTWGMKWRETGEYRIYNRAYEQKLYMTVYGPNVYKYFDTLGPIAMRTKVKI